MAALESLLAGVPGGVPAAALRFALAPPEVSVVLSGAASPAEIESAAGAAGGAPLDQALVEEVYRIGAGKQRVL